MDNDRFKLLAPAINFLVAMRLPAGHPITGDAVWRVCFHNAGQERISCQFVAIYNKADKTFQLADGQLLNLEEFGQYRRRQWPLDHETGRNPQNVTLGVQSAVGRQTAKM
jgi:hypothetical protein